MEPEENEEEKSEEQEETKPEPPKRKAKAATRPLNEHLEVLRGDVIQPNKKKPVRRKVAQAVVKRRSASESFVQTFFGEDAKHVLDHVLHEIVIPEVKNIISDVVSSTIELALFGDRRERPSRYRDRDSRPSYINYSRFSRSRDRDDDEEDAIRDLRRSARGRFNLDQIYFRSGKQATEVLYLMEEQLDRYRIVTVYDFFEMAGIDHTWADKKYGWKNLDNARVTWTRNGHQIIFPNPKELED